MLLTALAASALTALAQPATSGPAQPDFAALCESARAEAGSPAMGLVVATADAEPSIAVAGVRITGTDNAARPDDLWHWGSITKSMTATLVARLAERGTISWDDAIDDHLGGKVGTIRDTYQHATFAHLLSHRAGLQPNIPMDQFGTFHRPVEDPIADRLEWVSIALAQEPAADLADKNIYSNNGYIVAAAMLEAATGEPWETLIQREVFAPLGIEYAGFGDPAATSPEAQPRGHRLTDQHTAAMPAGADNPPALGPAGRVHMPLADIARYLRAHAQRPEDFLSEASFNRLHTPAFGDSYACGWITSPTGQHWHNGSNTMWYAEAAFDPESGTVAAVVANIGNTPGVRPAVSRALRALLTADD